MIWFNYKKNFRRDEIVPQNVNENRKIELF